MILKIICLTLLSHVAIFEGASKLRGFFAISLNWHAILSEIVAQGLHGRDSHLRIQMITNPREELLQ